MKKVFYVLAVPLLLAGGLVFANRGNKSEPMERPTVKQLTPAEREAAIKTWEATPGGMLYVQWKASPKGQKVLAAVAKINNEIRDSSAMEATITSLSLPPGSRLGFGVMARIHNEDYILGFGAVKPGEMPPLRSLKVGDKIIVRSRVVSHAPKYAYPIIRSDYVERDGAALYKRPPQKGGC